MRYWPGSFPWLVWQLTWGCIAGWLLIAFLMLLFLHRVRNQDRHSFILLAKLSLGSSVLVFVAVGLYVGWNTGFRLFPDLDRVVQLLANACTSWLVQLIAEISILLTTSLFFVRCFGSTRALGLRVSPLSKRFVGGLGLGLILIMGGPWIGWIASHGFGPTREADIAFEDREQLGVAVILWSMLAAPAIEEAFFRGVVLGRLRLAVPTWLAVIISSGVFSTMHVGSVHAIVVAYWGIVFGTAYVFGRSILVPFILHLIVNSLVIYGRM